MSVVRYAGAAPRSRGRDRRHGRRRDCPRGPALVAAWSRDSPVRLLAGTFFLAALVTTVFSLDATVVLTRQGIRVTSREFHRVSLTLTPVSLVAGVAVLALLA